MAQGESFRNANLVPGMALGELYYNVTLAADNTQINPLRNPFVRLTSDNTTAANRTFTLTNGSVDGQLIHIVLCAIGATTTGRAQLLSTGNVNLTGGSWEPQVNDTLTLQWDMALTTWREVSRSLPSIQNGATVSYTTYTPTFTAVTNVATATAGLAHVIRVGDQVIVSGTGSIASTAASETASAFDVSIPIASDLSASNQLTGSGSIGAATGVDYAGCVITGNTTDNRATFSYSASQTAAGTLGYTFMYSVV